MAQKLVVLISGSGTNLQALIEAVANGTLADTMISLVVSNRKDAYGLQRARNANIDTAYHNLVLYGKRFPSSDSKIRYSPVARQSYDADLAAKVLESRPTLVVCAGWMHVLSNAFLEPLAEASTPVINLHPALPGEYDGAGAIERAFEDFKQEKTTHTGVMIHYVALEVDRGPPIVIQRIEIETGDELEDLTQRIHTVEHRLIVEGTNTALEKLRDAGP